MPHGKIRSSQSSHSDPNHKLRVGVIGIGYLGKFHVEKYASIPEVQIVGLVDRLIPRAQEWANKLGAAALADYRELLGKVDAVSVVVPTDQHHRVAKDFLQSGSDVLLEKPISSTLWEAEDLISTAKKYGRILQVGHLERFNPALQAARDKIRAPLFLESHRLTSFRGRGTEVDVVLDLMIHDLDIILHIVRSKVEHIHAVGVPVLTQRVDIANARLQFEGGCVANITASRISVEDQRRIRIFQPDTFLTVDFAAKKVAMYRRIFTPGKANVEVAVEQIKVKPGDALETEIRSFVHSSMNREAPMVTAEDGKRALALALGINEQIRANIEKIPSISTFYETREGLLDAPW